VRLGAFQLDLRAGELLRGEARVVLQEQPLQVLLMLVEARGAIVTREEIKKRLWPNDTVVEFDRCIHTAINKLRKAFDDSADQPTYIQTVARRGYRLIVPVESSGDSSGDSSVAQSSDSGTDGSSPGKAGGRPTDRQSHLALSCAGDHRRRRHGAGLSR
jgi:DNA-binding winged helix-turn-helix (wHTH) protein